MQYFESWFFNVIHLGDFRYLMFHFYKVPQIHKVAKFTHIVTRLMFGCMGDTTIVNGIISQVVTGIVLGILGIG